MKTHIQAMCSVLVASALWTATSQAQTYVGGFDAMFLRGVNDLDVAFQVDDSVGPVQNNTAIDFDRSLDFAPRFWLGRVDDAGRMLRARFFWFDGSDTRTITTGVDETLSGGFGLGSIIETNNDQASGRTTRDQEMFVFDADCSQLLQVWNGRMNIGTGLRYTDITLDSSTTLTDRIDGDSTETTKFNLDGIGPSLFLDYERPFWCGLSAFTELRTSLMYGTSDVVSTATDAGQPPMTTRYSIDDVFMTHEWRFGLRAAKTVGAHTWFGSVSSEYQLYESSTFIGGDLGLAGIGFQVGMLR